jgi:hypothetical protein
MECDNCKTKLEKIISDGCIVIDVKSRTIKIYKHYAAHNYDDNEEMKKIQLNKTDKDKIKRFDFNNLDAERLVFCSINCYIEYNNFIKRKELE